MVRQTVETMDPEDPQAWGLTAHILNLFYRPDALLHRLHLVEGLGYDTPMHVLLHHPRRVVEIKGPKRVCDVLKDLKLLPETVLVIKGNELATEDETVSDADTLEIRPVISGG
ncbi:MAG: hypothetical protein L0Y56_21255 [Nitrospira sp.]|nr:hypothetical protein [Nitrospira sp.]